MIHRRQRHGAGGDNTVVPPQRPLKFHRRRPAAECCVDGGTMLLASLSQWQAGTSCVAAQGEQFRRLQDKLLSQYACCNWSQDYIWPVVQSSAPLFLSDRGRLTATAGQLTVRGLRPVRKFCQGSLERASIVRLDVLGGVAILRTCCWVDDTRQDGVHVPVHAFLCYAGCGRRTAG